jgi:alpha-mannosidase
MVSRMKDLLIAALTGGPPSSKDGVPGNQEDRRVEHIIPPEAVAAGFYDCVIEVSANGIFGLGKGGYRHQEPDVSIGLKCACFRLTPQMHVYYDLAIADIVCINSNAHALATDFQILAQIARAPNAATSGISQRAIRACNDMMNAFQPEAVGYTGGTDDMIARLRVIAWTVLGPLDAENQKTLVAYDAKAGEGAKIWAIGHW